MPGSFNGKTTSNLRKDKRMRCHAGSNPAPGTQNTFTPSLTKKQSTMEKNYIFRKDLGEIMEELAEEALNHADTMTTNVIIRKGEMNVCVYMNEHPYTTLSDTRYEIIDTLEESTDAMDRIFGDALVALENLTVIKTEETNNI